VLHQDFTAGIFKGTGIDRAAAAEAIACARAEVARRGLTPAVTKAYYALIVAQRKYGTAQQSLDQARHSLDISQNLEHGREVAHSDTVKFQLQEIAQQQALREAQLAMQSARLDLAALLFQDLNENFSVVDDLDKAPALPDLAEVQGMAVRENPTLRAAVSALRAADLDISTARQAYLPSLSVDFVYGIEANAFALHSTVAADPRLGPLPNLGYFLTASLNIPVWDWGVRRSKVHQAELKHEQAAVELSAAQRESIKNLRDYYLESRTARDLVDLLRHAAELASESLRLNGLRYQAGEATVLELVDAQNTVTQARNAYDDGMARYRLALANLQTLTGTF
jgi:outer membrane protein TolC